MGVLNALDKVSPILLFGYGNPSRGDDALGPLLIEYMEQVCLPHVDCLTDMQLQVEHVMDLEGRECILFIDADVACEQPYVFSQLNPEKDGSYTSHAMSPAALLHAYAKVFGMDSPPAYILKIRGFDFALGETVSDQALEHLSQAIGLVKMLCIDSPKQYWHSYLSTEQPSQQQGSFTRGCNYTLPTCLERVE